LTPASLLTWWTRSLSKLWASELRRYSRWGGINSEDQRVWGGLDAISASELIRDMEALMADS